MTKTLRVLEFIAIFGIVPLGLYKLRFHVAHLIALVIIIAGSGALFYLLRQPAFDRRMLWHKGGQSIHLKRALVFFAATAGVLLAAGYYFDAAHFLAFPRRKPVVWLLVMVLYPVLAAYPQELFFRGFFFMRYRMLFPHPVAMICANGICFGVFHLYFGNWVAPALSTIGGFLFAYRYWRSGSLLTVGIEHGLWGNYLFTIGIGWYFYSGSIQ